MPLSGLSSSTKVVKKPYIKPLSVKSLEDAKFIAKKQRYPNTPEKYLVKEKYRDDNANGLTKCIIDYLKLKGYQAERINTTGRMIDRRQTVTDVLGHTKQIGSFEWVPTTSTRGSADISAIINGRSVKIEVKIGADRQSTAQKEYQRNVEDAGGVYIIAHDFDGFLAQISECFARR